MQADLNVEAGNAIRAAAERLGVDPYRLAHFLSSGRLGDIVEAIGGPSNDRRRLQLAEEYLRFLDQEIADRQARRTGYSQTWK